uniref:Uncharacterized protein n=1 Tax=Candidatus Kentrum sp. LPFa TaxID=2126335 RepID=A0A450WQJ2_9GAMM|nr:MAG: hypothetical protein BECKLPF1236A_GA0070988_102203 [Candidatus Kentron sp. LPFa]VFK31136.1 MAG: hypothetical protein BECKLPF1236C_GA0070990_101294 [Candidatus Kentron sp. LPFa]
MRVAIYPTAPNRGCCFIVRLFTKRPGASFHLSSRHRKNKNSEQIGARARNTPFGYYCYANMLDLIRNFRLGWVRHGAWISIETVDQQFPNPAKPEPKISESSYRKLPR